MFVLRKNTLESDEGFTIQFGRDSLHYSRPGLTLRLNHEMLPRPKSLAIWRDSITSLNPDALLSSGDSERIVDDLVRAFHAVGYDLTVI